MFGGILVFGLSYLPIIIALWALITISSELRSIRRLMQDRVLQDA
jgi:hypothetical protein